MGENVVLGVIVLVVIFVAVLGRWRYDAEREKKEKMLEIIAKLGRLDAEEAADAEDG